MEPKRAARQIESAFELYTHVFGQVTERARARFEHRDWKGGQADSLERLDVYTQVVNSTLSNLRDLLEGDFDSKDVWRKIKDRYSRRIASRHDTELAETFFNSITRRVFSTVGVDPFVEFITPGRRRDSGEDVQLTRTYPVDEDLPGTLRRILTDFSFSVPYADRHGDAAAVAERLAELDPHTIEVLDFLFYRNKKAYLIGRLDGRLPLAISFINPAGQVQVHAVIIEEDELSKVFSFTRNYFRVATGHPANTVAFLKTLLPRKPEAELYISLGYNKHGKTKLFREFVKHLRRTDDQFVVARGERGMVMLVFTLPSWDVVFKIIKDRFAYPKTTTRQKVMDKYRLVFKHDRVGRLVDAQEFEHLTFSKARFSQELLDELLDKAAGTVSVNGDEVHVRHAYTERRVTPLDIYIRESSPDKVRDVVVEWGKAIKELAAAQIFPGDMFLKNFGVTRHGRVVFYDYDELCFLSECRFRNIPKASSRGDELADEPYFYVGPNDVFPQEFPRFLGLKGELRQLFEEAHGDLFTVEFWQEAQQRGEIGELPNVFPYSRRCWVKGG